MICVAEVMTELSEPIERRALGIKKESAEVLAYSDETCRAVEEEMATTGITRMAVVDRETHLICGFVSAHDLLADRKRAAFRESERNRAFQFDALIR
jgi:CBS domain containing-hemolysin-like protein